MEQAHQDPAKQWSGHLARLDGARRDAVIAALRHSAETGWPASGEAVALLAAYATGEISARDYADGILASLGAPDHAWVDVPRASASAYVAADVEEAPAEMAPAVPTVRREDAVQAYVDGLIPVDEFLRLARS